MGYFQFLLVSLFPKSHLWGQWCISTRHVLYIFLPNFRIPLLTFLRLLLFLIQYRLTRAFPTLLTIGYRILYHVYQFVNKILVIFHLLDILLSTSISEMYSQPSNTSGVRYRLASVVWGILISQQCNLFRLQSDLVNPEHFVSPQNVNLARYPDNRNQNKNKAKFFVVIVKPCC